jgi:hypothetical protein
LAASQEGFSSVHKYVSKYPPAFALSVFANILLHLSIIPLEAEELGIPR